MIGPILIVSCTPAAAWKVNWPCIVPPRSEVTPASSCRNAWALITAPRKWTSRVLICGLIPPSHWTWPLSMLTDACRM